MGVLARHAKIQRPNKTDRKWIKKIRESESKPFVRGEKTHIT